MKVYLDESPESRIDFATNSLSDANSYLRQSPDINYDFPVVKNAGSGWELNGVSIIDYEVVKIIALNFDSKTIEESFSFFAFPGLLSELPKAEPGNEYGLLYQAYSGDNYTLIAWQYTPELLGFIVAQDDPEVLAKIASKIAGK